MVSKSARSSGFSQAEFMRLLYIILDDTICKSAYDKSLEGLLRRELDNGERSILQWEEVISKRLNYPKFKPESQHNKIKKYGDPYLPHPLPRNELYLRKNGTSFGMFVPNISRIMIKSQNTGAHSRTGLRGVAGLILIASLGSVW